MADFELWKTIPEHPNYEASNLGNVRRHDAIVTRLKKPTINGSGYLLIGIDNKTVFLHYATYTAFHGTYNKKEYDIHHIDKNKLNNNISNLAILPPSKHRGCKKMEISPHAHKITDKTRPELEAQPSAGMAGIKIWGQGKKSPAGLEHNRYGMRIRRIWAQKGWEIPAKWRGRGRRPTYC